MESKHAPALCALEPREPPVDPPPGATPGMAATPGRMGVLGGTLVPPAYDAPRPCVEREDVSGEDDNYPVDAPIDMNAHTQLAYNNVHALNLSLCPGPLRTPPRTPAATRLKASPICNPYSSSQSRPSQHQTTIPETLGRERRPGMPIHVDTTTDDRRNDRGSGGGRPLVGGVHYFPSALLSGFARPHPWCKSL